MGLPFRPWRTPVTATFTPNFVVDGPDVPDTVGEAAGELFTAALTRDGTLTGEHGVGVLKRQWLGEERGEDHVGIQRDIKRVFDPHGILNPGKVFSIDSPNSY